MAFTKGSFNTINWLNIFLPSVTVLGIAIGGAAWWYHDTEVARKMAEDFAERQEVQRIVLARLDRLRADQLAKYVAEMQKAGVDVQSISKDAKSAGAQPNPGTPTAAAH